MREAFNLSEREIDVIKCICRGDTNKEIASHLFISELTVKGYLKTIFQKLGIHNRTTLVSKMLTQAPMSA